MKRLLISISAGFIGALAVINLYNYTIQPEIAYFRTADQISTQWENKLRASKEPCYILGGGSEIRSSISPAIMLQEHGIRAVNAATAATFGLVTNASIALNHIQHGDTLVLSLISTTEDDTQATESGTKLAVQLHGSKAFTKGIIPASPKTISWLFSGDAGSMLVFSMRMLSRGYGYAYEKEATIRDDGWMEVHRRGMQNAVQSKKIPSDYLPAPAFLSMLTRTQTKCRQAGADFVTMLPVQYSNEHETSRRLLHALHITRLGIPVLRDVRLGRITDTSKLADTPNHLNAEGTAENSRIIAQLLKEKSYWSEQELVERLRALGLADDGTPLP